MKAKKTISLLAATTMLAGAAPVFAGSDGFRTPTQRVFDRHAAAEAAAYDNHRVRVHHKDHADRGHRGFEQHRHVVVHERHAYPAYDGHPGYYGQPVYAEPAYHHYGYSTYAGRPDNSAAVLGGAALGAMIGSQVGDRHSRPAAMAFGAIFGAILGSELSDR